MAPEKFADFARRSAEGFRADRAEAASPARPRLSLDAALSAAIALLWRATRTMTV